MDVKSEKPVFTLANGMAADLKSEPDSEHLNYGVVNIYKNSNKKGGMYTNSDDSDNEIEEDADNDIISEYIGHYGWWQFMWTFLLCLFQIPTTFHIFCLVFQAANREFWCARPSHLQSIPLSIWKNLTQPEGQCTIVNAPYADLNGSTFNDYFENNNINELIACTKFEFDSQIFGSSIISEFGLVCDKAHMMSIVEMCFLAGAAMGSVCSGWISDQFGRRHTLMIFASIQGSIGVLLGFTNSLELYMALRVVIGFASMAVAVVSFVLVVELVSGKWRTVIGILNILPVAVAYILAAGIAYVTFEWRIMQFTITTPGILLLSIWYYLPESPRWLLAKGRIDELKIIIEKAAKMNGKSLPSNYEKSLIPPDSNGNEVISVFDLFKSQFRRTTLLMIVIWFSIILIYFGITLHLSNLGGDVYINTVIAGGVESIAICLSILVVLKLGLRVNLFIYMIIAGISCLMMNLVQDGNLWFIITLAMIVKCTVGACNAIIPTFTAYQYPTTMRNLGVGAGNFAAGLALIVVPYLWLLEHIETYLPMTIMGVFGLIGGFSLLILKDKLSKRSSKKGDESRRIQKDFPRNKSENGLANIGFTQNESIFL